MKDFYIWYCIIVATLGTVGNYWVVDNSRAWSSGGSGYTSTSGWHK